MSAARLARALVRDLARALPFLDDDVRPRVLDAVDGFLARPAPSTYLCAARRLSELTRLGRNARASGTIADRAFADGLELLRATETVDAETCAALACLPVDARAGRRLRALAQLIVAHGEIVARVRRAEELRAPMSVPSPAIRERPRRR